MIADVLFNGMSFDVNVFEFNFQVGYLPNFVFLTSYYYYMHK